jgi:Pentapeptide repeats (8 copies)
LPAADGRDATVVLHGERRARPVRPAEIRPAEISAGRILSGAGLKGTNLAGANLAGANLESAVLIVTDLTNADLTGCRIFGVSAWSLKLEGAKQQDLIITPGEPEITVDNIEVAQFVYLMLNNQKVRDVINTITSKAVLILGRFTDERKAVLDALREELRKRDLLPIFVIADVTDATEVRAELHKIVPDFPSLPVQPILLRGHLEFVSHPYLQRFPWFLPTFEYDDPGHLLASLDIVADVEAKVKTVEVALKKERRKIEAELIKLR